MFVIVSVKVKPQTRAWSRQISVELPMSYAVGRSEPMEERVRLQGVDRGCIAGIEELARECKLGGFGEKHGAGQTRQAALEGGAGQSIDCIPGENKAPTSYSSIER